MRNLPQTTNYLSMLVFVLLFALMSSCSEEDLLGAILEEELVNEGEASNDDPSSEDSPIPDIDTLEINTTPCDFSLDILEPNGSLSLECQIDLEGATIVLPMNVTLAYNGGEIINGALRFNGGSIDGKLLNHTLDIVGDASLIESTFQLYPERWDITQGPTTDEKSLVNRDNLRDSFKLVSDLGGDKFVIGALDAYFNVQTIWSSVRIQAEESIQLPSNFELNMSDETHLRVQPNAMPAYTLLTVYEGQNITVRGGHLYGDRWEHDYSPIRDPNNNIRDSHDWGHILTIAGGKNILVENITLSNASGDGFGVFGSAIRNANGSHGDIENLSENVTLRNATIVEARRNGMSILDGDGVLIENCIIKDTGRGKNPPGVEYSSAGTLPKYGVSFEAWRQRTSDGQLQEYNRIENVILRGNTFTGNEQGDIVFFTCSNITAENNFFDSRVANIASNNITIRNNTFEARTQEDGSPYNYAILLQSFTNEWDGELNYDYTISGNTIRGYGNAMILAGQNYTVTDNVLVDNKNSIGIGDLNVARFSGNDISSSVQYATGYFTRGSEPQNVVISNEKINIEYRAINLRNVNAASNDPLRFENSEFINMTDKDNFIENSSNIVISNNNINVGFILNNSTNIQIDN